MTVTDHRQNFEVIEVRRFFFLFKQVRVRARQSFTHIEPIATVGQNAARIDHREYRFEADEIVTLYLLPWERAHVGDRLTPKRVIQRSTHSYKLSSRRRFNVLLGESGANQERE